MLSSAERGSEYLLLPSEYMLLPSPGSQSPQLISKFLPQILLPGLPTSGPFTEVLQILPSQPPIKLVALASAMKLILE
jgi:hypothetical protein